MKINILFTDLSYLYHNYGSQAVALPLMEKISRRMEAKYTFALSWNIDKENEKYAREINSDIIAMPHPLVMAANLLPFVKTMLKIFLTLAGKQETLRREEAKLSIFIDKLKRCDIVIDLAGIEFVENKNIKRKWLNYINSVCPQYFARRHGKKYLKSTKSYGPFNTAIYRFLVKKQLDKLPCVFVRAGENFGVIKKLNLKTPVYSVPDISIALEPESRQWAETYLKKIRLDLSRPIIGLSPSAVIFSECASVVDGVDCSGGRRHLDLCEMIVDFFQKLNKQIVILPHSIADGNDLESCDLAVSRKIYQNLIDKGDVFLIHDKDLDYKKTRAIIGMFEFYIAGRYHAVSSALAMNVPVVSLSWHMKYRDIMSLFFDDYLAVDWRQTNSEKAMALIKKYYFDRRWFNEKVFLKKKFAALNTIENNFEILMKNIRSID